MATEQSVFSWECGNFCILNPSELGGNYVADSGGWEMFEHLCSAAQNGVNKK